MIRSLAVTMIALLAAPAFAQDYSREGFSVGLGVSGAFEEFDEDGGIDFDDTAAFQGFANYRFHPNFAVEARVEQTLDFEGDTPFGDVDVNVATFMANAQVFILTEQFQPYVIGGFGIADVEVDGPFGDDSESDPVWRLGIGLDSYMTPNFVIGIEAGYNFGTNDLDDFDYWTFGGLFRFRF
jgi:opacity protein-like surface antigen